MLSIRSRILSAFIIIFGMFLLIGLPTSIPVHASPASCSQGTAIIGSGFNFTSVNYPSAIDIGDTISVTITWNGGGTALLVIGPAKFKQASSPLTVAGTVNFAQQPSFGVASNDQAAGQTFTYTASINGGTCGGSAVAPSCVNLDNRLNSICNDSAQTAAVYCEKDGSVSVWAINNGKGNFAFSVTPEEIAKVPAKPAINTLIKQNLGARLYRLTSGQLQLNRAQAEGEDDYFFRFNDCPKP